MADPFSLYLDHQRVAPLVRQLEATVQACSQQQEAQTKSSEVRSTLYRHFLSLLHNLYLERNPQLKNQDGSVKLEALPEFPLSHMSPPMIEGLISKIGPQTLQKKNGGPLGRAAEVEQQLMQWISSCQQRIFDKKEIDAKYRELLGDSKRTLSLAKLREAVERSGLPALIVRTRNGEEHFFGANLDVSGQTEPKVEENSIEPSIWEQDDRQTVKNSIGSPLNEAQFKEQESEWAQNPLNQTQPIPILNLSSNKIIQEQSCDSFLCGQRRR